MTNTESIPIDTPKRHVDTGISTDWIAVRAGEELVIINEAGEGSVTAYTPGQTTKNPRVIAQADAILWEGTVGLTGYEDGWVYIQHRYAGLQEELLPGEFLDEPVPTLERTQMVSLEGHDG